MTAASLSDLVSDQSHGQNERPERVVISLNNDRLNKPPSGSGERRGTEHVRELKISVRVIERPLVSGCASEFGHGLHNSGKRAQSLCSLIVGSTGKHDVQSIPLRISFLKQSNGIQDLSRRLSREIKLIRVALKHDHDPFVACQLIANIDVLQAIDVTHYIKLLYLLVQTPVKIIFAQAKAGAGGGTDKTITIQPLRTGPKIHGRLFKFIF